MSERASALPSASEEIGVTGLGAVSALGTGCAAHRRALEDGTEGIRAVSRFDTASLATTWGGTWPGWDGRRQPEPGPERDLASCAGDFPLLELAVPAAREAWAGAELDRALAEHGYERRRIAIVLGTCFGQGFRDFHEVGEGLAKALGSLGPCITISTACASSANAIGLARDLVRLGHADVAIAGGVDTLMREAFAGFSALGVLSPEPCAPFSEPIGTTLGEGAGFLVLERASRATARGARIWGAIHGYGLSADAFHETSPDPSGSGIARAVRGALSDARWPKESIDVVNAHATGTANNDRTEWQTIERELHPGVLVSGTKGTFGHTQGASGALELVFALWGMDRNRVPPTLHFQGARPGCPSDPAPGPKPRAHATRRALKLTAAFGGANAVLAYGPRAATDADADAEEAAQASSRVVVESVRTMSPGGLACTVDEILGASRQEGIVRELPFETLAREIDPRRLDRSSRYLVATAAACLDAAGLVLRGKARDEAGLFVGATRMPEESAKKCRDSIRYRGIAATSAAAFARMSVNAPVGACAKALSLRGPCTTASVGEGSGLLAIVLAAEWLARRRDAAFIIAGSVDELNPAGADTEGAVCALLRRQDADAPSSPKARVVVLEGWGIAGPHDLEQAAASALRGRGLPDVVISDGEAGRGCLGPAWAADPKTRLAEGGGFIDVSAHWGRAEASRSAVAFALAVAYLEEGRAESALVVTARSRSLACAALVTVTAPAAARHA